MVSSESSKRILLLVNPKARSGSTGSDQIRAALEEAGHHVTIPGREQDFREAVNQYARNVDLVVVGGGDGTVNHLLRTLVETKLPLIVFPLGTANLFARSFNIKADIKQLIELTREGVPVQIDLGVVNGIYFINVCGLGISTEVNQKISPKLKKLAGPFSFWIEGLRLLKHLEPFRIQVSVDDEKPIKTKTWQMTIRNGRKYAAWMTIQPDASYDDGLLRLLSTEVTNWWEGLRLLPSYLKGTYKDEQHLSLKAAKKIRIESRKPLSIDVDGDVQTTTPATFEVHRKVLNIILPSAAIVTDETPISHTALT